MIYLNHYLSPIGNIILKSNETKLIGLYFADKNIFHEENKQYIQYQKSDLNIFKLTKQWLDIYFSGRTPDFIPPLEVHDTAFRESVWKILLDIPYGQTTTYGIIASQIAKQNNIYKMSARAVGNAVGHNPISIIIPCHRVIGSNGKITGYSGGIDKKIALLNLEKEIKII